MRRRCVARTWAVGVLLASVLAGCGGHDGSGLATAEPKSNGIAEMKPPQALRTALRAHRSLKDASFVGRLPFLFPVGPRTVSAKISATKGGACAMELSSVQVGKLTVRLIGDEAYVKGNDKAITEVFGATPTTLGLLEGRWLKGPTPPDFAAVCTRTGVLPGELDIDLCRPGGTDEVNGVPTVTLRCSHNGAEQHIQVAATGAPYVLRMDGTVPARFELDLTGTNSGVEVVKPAARDVIDIEALR